MTTAVADPHSLDAEKAVLGCLLVEGTRFLDIGDRLAAGDFYRAAHQTIYSAIRDMAARGEHIDDLTVKEYLEQRHQLDDVGGPAYLFSLFDGMPRGFNLEAAVRIVRDRADKARLAAAARRILTDVQESQDDARTVIDRAERLIFEVAQQDARGDFIPAATLVADGIPEIEQLLDAKTRATGVRTGFDEFDELTRGLHPGTLVILAARPSMGKSAWALQVAYHAATSGTTVGFLSLEMSRHELFLRLVASVGRIDGHRLQSGYVNQTDYGRLGDTFSQIADSSLWVDDSAVVSVLDVRGKARRLAAKQGLGLLVIDYLQLMQLGRAENRNLAIAEASRGLKLVARELGIPVLALSQLSRETERRGDKRPMLSDLRDCLPGDARLVMADGTLRRVEEIVSSPLGELGKVLALDADWRITHRPITGAWPVGQRDMVQVTTATGRILKCSTEHQIFTEHGWQPASQIAVGTLAGLPRHLPQLTTPSSPMTEDQALLLGWLVGDGCFHGSPALTVATKAEADMAVALGHRTFDLTATIRAEHPRTSACRVVFSMGRLCGAGGNPMTRWLRSLGVWKSAGEHKHVPSAVFAASDLSVSAFLRGLFHADGTCAVSVAKRRPTVKLSTISERLARDVHLLLMRFGIVATVRAYNHKSSGFRTRVTRSWTVGIYTNREIEKFLRLIGFLGEKQARAMTRFRRVKERSSGHIDRLPPFVNQRITALRRARGLSHRALGWRVQGKKGMSRSQCGVLAELLGDAVLRRWATSDILWDRIVAVEPLDAETVFDLTVGDLHNFVVDGFITHNSGALEQDADLVVFIHRPEVYGATPDTAGLAEIIVSKQRNGPTGTVKLAWRKAETRFDDWSGH
jgi:replicative DNA helicase